MTDADSRPAPDTAGESAVPDPVSLERERLALEREKLVYEREKLGLEREKWASDFERFRRQKILHLSPFAGALIGIVFCLAGLVAGMLVARGGRDDTDVARLGAPVLLKAVTNDADGATSYVLLLK